MKQAQQVAIARIQLLNAPPTDAERRAKTLPRREPPRVHFLRENVALDVDGDDIDAPVSAEQIAAMPRDIW